MAEKGLQDHKFTVTTFEEAERELHALKEAAHQKGAEFKSFQATFYMSILVEKKNANQ